LFPGKKNGIHPMSGNCDLLFLTASACSDYRFGDLVSRALWRHYLIADPWQRNQY